MRLFSGGVTEAGVLLQTKKTESQMFFGNFLKFQEQQLFRDALGESIHIGHV